MTTACVGTFGLSLAAEGGMGRDPGHEMNMARNWGVLGICP